MPTNQYVFDCSNCPTQCDGISKGTYIFKSDVEYSEHKEQLIINQINNRPDFKAEKCEKDGYPDILVTHIPTSKTFYIEIKAQRRTFMAVKKYLPEADLVPSETVACNLSDILRYIEIRRASHEKIFVMWCLENRPCIVEDGKTNYYHQDLDELERIYNAYHNKRRFRRESGQGDYVNGKHKGVVVNYHFSLNELIPSHLLEILNKGIE